MSRKKWTQEELERLFALRQTGKSWDNLTEDFPDCTPNALRKAFYNTMRAGIEVKKPGVKVLLVDIETAPMVVYAWGLFDQNIGLEQIIEDWAVLSFSAKWLGSKEIIYHDNRNKENPRDDKDILKIIHSLLDECDCVITQNGKRFDIPKLNARFIAHGMQPPSSYRIIDTLRIAKANFAFTSNKLAYMTDKLCTFYKKLTHKEFPGFDLWKQCLAGNKKAWAEMQEYNNHDVLSMEELYKILAPWDKTINFNVYSDDFINRCSCGNTEFKPTGHHYTNRGRYKKYKCTVCGKEHRDTQNLLSKEKRKDMKVV